ncbi:FAD-dependent oxidoreductase [Candidatus Formimonas warabiya]|uniref:4Fe-4S ferredoxin-type domain-containing protein n=1 Tax=Formimonas warabiya TaxID=1761012 RepID=A0A3G1KWE4_FORW1|nr:FAD-dependent oxidoreductase [Candidatus Formimonas warabiya]ATW26689.1 hypothetical protein DCMF_19720 [Candidatus Formimonas warabiya]
MQQYGFFIDTSRCTGCNACVIACKQYKDVPPGPAKPIRVYQWEKGVFPDIDVRALPIMCFHCAKPRCMEACEHHAIYKDETYGAVLVDPAKCQGDRNCFNACPYGSPQFLSDAPSEKMLKCDMCIDRLKDGKKPLCVLSCSLRALDFGLIKDMKEKYGEGAGKYIIQDAPAPCRDACPARVDIESYMDLTEKGEYTKALEVCLEVTPFAGILGRVCTHSCEIDCFRGRFDDATAIRETKRFLADYDASAGKATLPQCAPANGKNVAVVGGGPAGLSCAYALAQKGYGVTIFEQSEEMGGMMRYGIPAYRLPRAVLKREIDLIKELDVKFVNNHRISDLSEFADYDAVFVATGAGKGISLSLPGSDSKGIRTAVDFLRDVNTGILKTVKDEVVVIGGGSVAMDAARTALRMGAPHVHLVCLESSDYKDKEPMPAQEMEVKEAREEGIIIHDKHGVQSFDVANGAVRAVNCVRCLSVMDENGKFAPCYAKGDAVLRLSAGLVLVALGQCPSEAAYPIGLPRDESQRIAMRGNFQTEDPRIFAGGDLLTGTTDIITAVAVGNETAESIHRYCQGLSVDENRRMIPNSSRSHVEKKSMSSSCRAASERCKDFDEVCLGFNDAECAEQSGRCLHCGEMKPSAVIRRQQPKKNILPWNKEEAMQLWAKRHSENGEALPDVFESIKDVLDPEELPAYGRGRLMLRVSTSEEKLFYTTDDE